MKTIIDSIVVAFAMYSGIPFPKTEWKQETMRFSLCAFPLVGIPIMLLQLFWMRFAVYMRCSDLLRSAVLTVIPVAVTGGIHLDGLLDTADAVSSWKTPEERLEIMKDSHSGAFAIIWACCYFALSLGVFSQADGSELFLIGLGYLLSRSLSALAAVYLKKAKNTGLLRTFSDAADKKLTGRIMIAWVSVLSLILVYLDPVRGVLQVLLAALVFLWYRWISYRQFGGITGDLEGFFLEIAELVMALGVVII